MIITRKEARKMRDVLMRIAFGILPVVWAATLAAEEPVVIEVDASSEGKPFSSAWAYFGYDEPNYTYAENGRKLLLELSSLSPAPVYIRAHNLLTSGDGKHALKWGSTNAYNEDASGRPVYDWTILDRIFDTYVETGVKPLVEIGFMPEALSVKPQPYRHTFPQGAIWTGWAYPPKDYRKWAELVYQWVRHSVERYGKAEVQSWYWEVWNEPDIGYWQGTPEEYHKLYDHAVDAVKRALPEARVGGPHSTGPGHPRAAEFLRNFLEHCARGTNHATGKTGSPLDFVAFHAKGNPQVVDGRVRMGSNRQLQSIAKGFEIVASFPEFRHLPVIIGESDPEGCAACSARVHPQNAYRNGTLYPAYTAAVYARTLEFAEKYNLDLRGAVTWAFEFEDQPYFDGFRSLSTNGIDKPVLNIFRMFGLMKGRQLRATSSQSTRLEDMLSTGVSGPPDNGVMSTRSDRTVSALVWNYHDDDVPAPGTQVNLQVNRLPADASRVLVRHYRIDQTHSNAYTVWQRMGSPQNPTPEQYAQLIKAGQLQMLSSPEWKSTEGGKLQTSFTLPRQGISLVQMSW
jgi:xylan 1,4-beta-xylosidase